MVLWSGCFVTWLRFLTRYRVDADQWTDCKLFTFMFYFGRHYSSSLLVLLSLEKCFAVYFPLKSKTVCTVRTAKWLTGIVAVILTAYNSIHLFYLKSFVDSSGSHSCVYSFDYYILRDAINSVLYSFGPFVLILLTNVAIGFKFMRAKCKSNSTESTNQALIKVATRGTAMVVIVSVMFLILTAPTAVHSSLTSVIRLGSHPVYRVFMNLTQYLNHSINGVLYCMVGSRFRREFFQIFRRKDISENLSTPHSVNSTSVVTVSGTRVWTVWNVFYFYCNYHKQGSGERVFSVTF